MAAVTGVMVIALLLRARPGAQRTIQALAVAGPPADPLRSRRQAQASSPELGCRALRGPAHWRGRLVVDARGGGASGGAAGGDGEGPPRRPRPPAPRPHRVLQRAG